MEFVHEVTAHLENKPGRLAKICAALAHEKIDIRALSVMDTKERSVLRLVVDQIEPTGKVLTSLGTEFEQADAAGSTAPGRSLAIFHTSNPKRAMQVLNEPPSNGVGRPNGRRPLHAR
jgi:hypothetical protein